MVKTIEQILGIKPMNQEDLAAEPMYGAFTRHPNFAPYNVLPNQIPLTLGAPGDQSTLTIAARRRQRGRAQSVPRPRASSRPT